MVLEWLLLDYKAIVYNPRKLMERIREIESELVYCKHINGKKLCYYTMKLMQGISRCSRMRKDAYTFNPK